MILRMDGSVYECNPKAAEMLGYSMDELLALNLRDWDVQLSDDDINRVFQSLSAGSIALETKHRRKDGKLLHVDVNAKIFEFNHRRFIYASARNISDRIATQQALLLAKEQAEQATKAKSVFLANMSHEIRTPLNGVIGLNALLLKTPLTRQQADYVHKSLQSAKALLGVINDILDYSKIEAGKLELSVHDFSLAALLHTTSDLFEYAIVDKGLSIHVDIDRQIPKVLLGDSLRLTQILNNLVGNAIKFTEQGEIRLSAQLVSMHDSELVVCFSVTDTGVGMTENELAKLFHAFSQTDASNTRKYGGTGLGLVITKQLVEMMNGEIGVNSVKGKGTAFHFTVKLAVGQGKILAQKHSSHQVASRRSLAPKATLRFSGRVLVAEDKRSESVGDP